MDLRLLVLSVGTRVGQNVLDTLDGRRDGVLMIATSSVANEPAIFDYDVVYRVPETAANADAFERALLDILEREHVDLVIPCRDDDVAFLASLRQRRPDLANRLLCGGTEAAGIIGDKWISAQFSERNGLPFVPSIIRGSDAERTAFVERYGFPLIAKPRRGYASLGVYMLSNEDQLRTTLEQDGYIVQQLLGDASVVTDYLEKIRTRGVPLNHTFQGPRHSIQTLIAPDGRVASVTVTRIVGDRRRSRLIARDDAAGPREIGARSAEAFAAAGWRGPLNIQCQPTSDGRLLIHEFNGRFTGHTFERLLLGYDEVGMAIENFTGRALNGARKPASGVVEAFQMISGSAADPANVATFERTGTWRRPR